MKAIVRWFVVLVFCLSPIVQARGQGTEAEKRHFESIKAQAARGDAEAQLALGTCYAFGTGVGRDSSKAVKWHRKAAEQGLAKAQLKVAYEYANGVGVKEDPIEAATWLHRAAEKGLVEAQFELGRCYAEGKGVGENPGEAARCYRKAADQHFAPAQFALGQCYFDGYGVTKNTPDGLNWIRRAAEQGYGPAENRLGMCYAKGQGVKQDYVLAYQWFNLAEAQGGEHNTEAKINLSMAERAMTPAQIAEGQKLAEAFKPRTAQADSAPSASVTATTPNSTTALVSLKCDDDTSEIFVDGGFVGNPPAQLHLEPGNHVFEVKKSGYKAFRRELKVTAGAELNLHAVLERE